MYSNVLIKILLSDFMLLLVTFREEYLILFNVELRQTIVSFILDFEIIATFLWILVFPLVTSYFVVYVYLQVGIF